ncbi:MAG: 50S ribosomal protein L28 [Bacillota bacterium]|nr:50S ribosomal protein L28 [Bacillota bacterium]
MARRCEICGREVAFGHTVSHSNRKSNRLWRPNLQTVRVEREDGRRRIRVCTRCLRSGRVARAV